MSAMVYPVSPSPKKWPEPTKEAPSPLMGEDQFVAMPSFRRTPESSAFIKLDRDFRRDDLVMETTP